MLIYDSWAEDEEKFKKLYKIVWPDYVYDETKKKHSVITQVKEFVKEIRPKKTVVTHFGCQAGFHEDLVKKHETEEFLIGYDGIKIIV